MLTSAIANVCIPNMPYLAIKPKQRKVKERSEECSKEEMEIMGDKILDKVYFGAKMAAYTGRSDLSHVGERGVLLVYRCADAKDECLLVFYYDNGPSIGWVRHSRSRCSLDGGVLSATSVRSGTVKAYEVSTAVAAGPEVFRIDAGAVADPEWRLGLGNLAERGVPDEWFEIFVNIFPDHAWADSGESQAG